MGLGHTLSEAFVMREGRLVTDSLKSLGIIPAAGMPPVEVILVEEPQPEGPYGAKGMVEAVLVPTASAVAGALHAFDGVWRTSLPMRDTPAARAEKCEGNGGRKNPAHDQFCEGIGLQCICAGPQ